MRLDRCVAVLVVSAGLSVPAFASATLSDATGVVRASPGGRGFVRIQVGANLNVGTSVMANPRSRGVLRYDDGCEVQVVPGRTVRVLAVSPCKAAAVPQTPPPAIVAAPVAGVVGGVSPAVIGLGAVVLGGGLAIGLANGNGGKSSP